MRSALALVLLVSCGTETQPTCAGGVLVVTTDYGSSSEVGALPLDGSAASMQKGDLLGGDPALATSADRHFFIARDLDAIYEIDSCGRGINTFSARAAGETTKVDPQDVAVAPNGALWVPRFTTPSLLVIGSPETVVDMSKFDADGNPDMSSVRIVGNHAFVALERLNPYPQSQQPSQVAVLDMDSLTLVKTIPLPGRNPFGQMKASAGELWMAAPGNFDDASETDAGIEFVDPLAMTATLLVPETMLGGSAAEVAVSAQTSTPCGAVIVADATPNVNATSLETFALDGSSVSSAVIATPGFDLRGLFWTSENPPRLLVGDKRVAADGAFPVHVFSVGANCALSETATWSVPDMPALAFAD